MIKLLVIADDLTGSLDTGVQFARQGLKTQVSLFPNPPIASLPEDVQVLVVNTESRHIPPEEAFQRVRAAVAAGREYAIDHFYKKTDSTLRGNIGAELDALLSASGGNKLCFIPAFPKAGRTVSDGILHLDGTPVHLTCFGSDPLNPVRTSSITEIISLQSQRPSAVISQAKPELPAKLKALGAQFLIFDAGSDSELAAVGLLLREAGLLGITAGPAGFAGVLPGLLGLSLAEPAPVRFKGPILLLNGSLNQVSRDQVRFARQQGVRFSVIPGEFLLNFPGKEDPGFQGWCKSLMKNTGTGRDLVLSSSDPEAGSREYFSRNRAQENVEAYTNISTNLGKVTASILDKGSFATLAVIGGDTLAGVLNELKISGIEPLGEIAPGVPVSRFAPTCKSLSLVSKAGGFGEQDIIMKIINFSGGESQ